MLPELGNASLDEPGVPRRLVYPVPEAAELLGGITDRTVWKLIASKKLKSIKVAGRRMITAEALTEYVNDLTEAAS